MDVLTVEIEHVDAEVLEEVQRTYKVEVHPSPSTIRIIQDKFRQKEHLKGHGTPVAESISVDSTVEGVESAARTLGLPLMLKSKTLAYDGRGNFVLREIEQAEEAIEFLGDRPLYAERWVPFVKEVAVMVVRTMSFRTPSSKLFTRTISAILSLHHFGLGILRSPYARGGSRRPL